jgi:hypothetical protein
MSCALTVRNDLGSCSSSLVRCLIKLTLDQVKAMGCGALLSVSLSSIAPDILSLASLNFTPDMLSVPSSSPTCTGCLKHNTSPYPDR